MFLNICINFKVRNEATLFRYSLFLSFHVWHYLTEKYTPPPMYHIKTDNNVLNILGRYITTQTIQLKDNATTYTYELPSSGDYLCIPGQCARSDSGTIHHDVIYFRHLQIKTHSISNAKIPWISIRLYRQIAQSNNALLKLNH